VDKLCLEKRKEKFVGIAGKRNIKAESPLLVKRTA
tara:strand:- start:57 stop:161 length:105 start_codon:yes stop_codon:yes gene_type:complete